MDTKEKLKKNGISLDDAEIKELCEKYHLTELAVFGSALRDDFTEDSDVDILVSFDENFHSTLIDILDLKDFFSNLLNREVDIVEKEGLSNPFRKKSILSTKEVIYAVQ